MTVVKTNAKEFRSVMTVKSVRVFAVAVIAVVWGNVVKGTKTAGESVQQKALNASQKRTLSILAVVWTQKISAQDVAKK